MKALKSVQKGILKRVSNDDITAQQSLPVSEEGDRFYDAPEVRRVRCSCVRMHVLLDCDA